MQNKYVGDIGDFGKYGLMREIFGRPEEPGTGCGLTLGVAWYLNKDDGGPDGNKTKYLKLKVCDPFLYDRLQPLTEPDKRKVSNVERSGILPSDTLYHNEPFCGSTRTMWFKGVLEATKDAAVVFIDPDNGIASEKTPVGSPKHVLPYELEHFYERGQSLIIYHHLARKDANNQIMDLTKKLQEYLDLPNIPWALWYHRGTARAYFIVPHKNHRDELQERVKAFKDSQWYKQGHFEQVT